MTPFYYIDGPWKDLTQHSDFRPTLLKTGEIYYKYTFAKKIELGILFTDIASINPNLQELKIEDGIPFYIRLERETTLRAVPPGGEIG